MRILLRCLSFIVAVSIGQPLFSQSVQVPVTDLMNPAYKDAAEKWETYFRNSQVEILYRYFDCHDETNGIHQEKVFFKFINRTGNKLLVSFAKELFYNRSHSISTDEKVYKLYLQPNKVVEGFCSDKDTVFYIFSKQLNFNSTMLQNFELKNIEVKTID